jgi:hypothetical protein
VGKSGSACECGRRMESGAREGRVRARVPRHAVQCGPSDEGEMERGWGRAAARAWTPRAHVRRRVQEYRTDPTRGERDPNRSSPFSNGCELSAGSAEAMKWELEGKRCHPGPTTSSSSLGPRALLCFVLTTPLYDPLL